MMRSQEVLVNRFIQWERIHERLKKFPNIGSHYTEKDLKLCSIKPPYYCHYLAWRLGTWHDETPWGFLDRLLAVASKLPNWLKEFRSFKNSCEYGEYWSLLWQLQVGQFFATRENSVKWNPAGPDLEVTTNEGKFFIECYTYRRSFGIKEFIKELFLEIDPHIRVEHPSYTPFSLPQDTYTDSFLHELFSPYLDAALLSEAQKKAKNSWPVPLPIPDRIQNFRIYYKGNDPNTYDPTVYPSSAGAPERYLVDALEKAISSKRDSGSKQLHCFRPNVLAINYLLSEEFQTANTRQKQLDNKIPNVNFGETIDAVYLAACGIDTVFSKGTLIVGQESHPFTIWLKRHGLISLV